jgi:hypothetical protein
MSSQEPEPGEAARQAERDIGMSAFACPPERCTEVVVLRLQASKPRRLVVPSEVRLALFGEMKALVGVPM